MTGFWSSETLHDEISELIHPFRPDRITNAAYELSMGEESYITRTDDHQTVIHTQQSGQLINIPPGQFALLLTEECIAVPEYAIGFISIKFSLKLRGLINVSGFHVDPGYEGKLLFSVFNAGSQSITIMPGAPTFLLWYASLSSPTTDLYDGSRKGRVAIVADEVMNVRGTPYSPNEIVEKLSRVEDRVRDIEDAARTRQQQRSHLLISIFSGIIVLIVSVIITLSLNNWFGDSSAPSDPLEYEQSERRDIERSP